MLATPKHPAALALPAAMLFILRPVSYAFVRNSVSSDRTPFDAHGFAILGEFMVMGVLTPPFMWLLVRVWRRYQPGQSLLAPASTPVRTALSVAFLLLAALPLPAQWDALRFLHLSESWPVALSALAWLSVAAFVRAAAVTPVGTATPGRTGRA